MSASSVVGGTVRGVAVAAVIAGTALGAAVIFDPFHASTPAVANSAGTPAARAMQERIETLRLSLRQTEDAIADAGTAPASNGGLASEYESQIAAAIERRDLAQRHAKAIRDSLEANAPLSSLAAIRESVVIGQLMSQLSALDGRIAIEGARLRAAHPTMRALTAQRTALSAQIRQEAESIATALEGEARIDDAQIDFLRAQLTEEAPPAAAVDTAALASKAAAQRAELDGLVDAYFQIPPAANEASPRRDPLTTSNLAIAALAGLGALVVQLMIAIRRRRRAQADDIAAWEEDEDPETPEASSIEPHRKAA